MFQELELFKKSFLPSGGNFPSSKNFKKKKKNTLKIFLMFQEAELSSTKLKKFILLL